MVKPNQRVYFDIPIQNPATGAGEAADSTPTAIVYKNGAVDAAVVPVVNAAVNFSHPGYFDVPGGYAAGDNIKVKSQATKDGITSPAIVVWEDYVDTVRTSEVNSRIGAPVGVSISADIQTRSTLTAAAVLSDPNYKIQTNADGVRVGSILSSVITTIANEVEAQIIDEADAEKVLDAISAKIAQANPDLSGLTIGAIKAAVRAELATELARIDVSIGSRLASSAYVAPDNANIVNAANSAATAATQAATAAEQATEANTLAAEIKTTVNAIKAVVVDKLNTMLESVGSNYRFTSEAVSNVSVDLGEVEVPIPQELTDDVTFIREKVTGLGTAVLVATAPVSPDGKTLRLTPGDDYYAADGRALEWEDDTWPDLTGGSVTLTVGDEPFFSVAGTVVAARRVRVELPRSESAKLPKNKNRQPPFELLVAPANGHHLRPVIGETLLSIGPTP